MEIRVHTLLRKEDWPAFWFVALLVERARGATRVCCQRGTTAYLPGGGATVLPGRGRAAMLALQSKRVFSLSW